MKKRKILSQGDRDGACFLYAIANAVGALRIKGTGQTTPAKWRKAVRSTPFDLVEFLAGRGTANIDGKPDLLEGFCREFLSALGHSGLKVDWMEGVRQQSELAKVVSHDRVFLMSVNNDAHWLTVVDTDETHGFLACSAEALDGTGEYAEGESPRERRTYNMRATMRELKVGKGCGLLISR